MSNGYTTIVNQAIDLLGLLSEDEYQQTLPPHFSSCVGSHMRHIVDHFLALMNGHINGQVDYNVRHRHNDIEKYPHLAIEKFREISSWLNDIPDEYLDKPVTISSEVDVSPTQAPTCVSTLGRELVFVSSHAIHHYAIIRTLCNMLDKPVPEFFGYASTTIKHINKTA